MFYLPILISLLYYYRSLLGILYFILLQVFFQLRNITSTLISGRWALQWKAWNEILIYLVKNKIEGKIVQNRTLWLLADVADQNCLDQIICLMVSKTEPFAIDNKTQVFTSKSFNFMLWSFLKKVNKQLAESYGIFLLI